MNIIAFSRSLRDFLNGEHLVISGKSQFQYLESELELVREALSFGTAISIERVLAPPSDEGSAYHVCAHDPLSEKFNKT